MRDKFTVIEGQSAIEYLMTYGWMLLVVAVVGGAIFSIVQSQSVESVSGFSGGGVVVDDFGTTSAGNLQLVLRNTGSDGVDVSEVVVSGEEVSSAFVSESIGVGETGTVTLSNVEQGSSANSLDLEVVYDVGGLTGLSSSGSLSGNFEVVESSTTYDGLDAGFSVNDSSPEPGVSVGFDGSVSSPSSEISSYSWSSPDTTLDESSGESISHVFGSEGDFLVNLTVGDGLGNESSYSETVVVSSGSSPADFQLSGVSDDGPVTEGSDLTVDYNVDNVGGSSGVQDISLDVEGVEEDVNSSVSVSSGGSSSGSLVWSTSQGDAGSGVSYSVSTSNDSVSGSVDIDSLSGPSASASDNVTDPVVGDVVEFDASGSSAGDGSITGYDWDVNGDGVYEKSGRTVTHSYSSSGSRSVELNVTDSNGLSSTDTVNVDVQEASVAAPSVGGEWSHVEPAGAEGGYDYFFNSSTTPYGVTYGGNSSVEYTSDGFYIMKYHASNDGSNVPLSDGSAGWNSISFNDAGGSPNAYDACEVLDDETSDYDIHLTTNREWMTVARQVAQDSSNWVDQDGDGTGDIGSTGIDGGLYQGNHDEGGNYDRAVNLGDYPEPASSGGETERTHNLSSGDQVWDMSGDVYNWVDAEEDGTDMSSPGSGGKLYEKDPRGSQVGSRDSNQAKGLGEDSGFSDGDAALRGGRWGDGTGAGVFDARSYAPSGSFSTFGFRCSAVPVS